ncbi:hypothetical protein JMJ77_0007611, partial [Colletotrichum scovillei]
LRSFSSSHNLSSWVCLGRGGRNPLKSSSNLARKGRRGSTFLCHRPPPIIAPVRTGYGGPRVVSTLLQARRIPFFCQVPALPMYQRYSIRQPNATSVSPPLLPPALAKGSQKEKREKTG